MRDSGSGRTLLNHRLRMRFVALASIPGALSWLAFGGAVPAHAQGITEFTCLPGTIAVTTESFTATEGVAFTGEVATWTEPAPQATAATTAAIVTSPPAPVYKALITWETGKSDIVTLTPTSHDDGSVTGTVSGTHTYAEEHQQVFVVRVAKLIDNEADKAGCAFGAADIANAALTATKAADLSTSEFGLVDDEDLATFTDANGTPDSRDFSATVDWGDATALDSEPSIRTNQNGSFTVSGSHTYHEGGSYTVTVTITDNKLGKGNKTSTATATLTANVTDKPLEATGKTATSTEGAPTGTVLLATFTDSNSDDVLASNYTATVDWKDGSAVTTCSSTSTTCTISSNSENHNFEIKSSHTYAEENAAGYKAHVTVTDKGGATASADATIKVSDAALTAANGQAINVQQNLSTGNVVTATFTDANPNKDKTDFTATIDWGDGKTSAGTVSVAAGTFSVTGSHTYTSTGSFTVKTAITDTGSSTASATAAASVAAPPVLASTGRSWLIPPDMSGYAFLAGLLMVLGVLGWWAVLRDRFVWSSKKLR